MGLVFITLLGNSQTVTDLEFDNLMISNTFELNQSPSLIYIPNSTILPLIEDYDSSFNSSQFNFNLTIQNNGTTVTLDLGKYYSSIGDYSTGETTVKVNNTVIYEEIWQDTVDFQLDTLLNDGDVLFISTSHPVLLTVVVLDLKLTHQGDPNSVFENTNGEVKIFPNPVTTYLNFEFKNNSPKQVTYMVYNMSGELVKQGELTNTLYVGDLITGNYIITLNIDGITSSKEFFKQ